MTRFFALDRPVSSSSSPSILPSAFCSRLSKSLFKVNLLLQSPWYAMEGISPSLKVFAKLSIGWKLLILAASNKVNQEA